MNKKPDNILKRIYAALCITFLAALSAGLLSGCWGGKIPHTVAPDYRKMRIRTIAVLPVYDQAKCSAAPAIIREKMIDSLYFRGYRKISAKQIDEKLEAVYREGVLNRVNQVPPRTAGSVLGVDALMFITINQCYGKPTLVYAPLSITASFELRSAKTGVTLWETSFSASERNFDITGKRLEMKEVIALETVIQEITEKVMDTMPEGPAAGK